jgi:hypothetical protein
VEGQIVKLGFILVSTILFSTPAAAEKIDKSKLLEVTRRDCPAQMLENKQLSDALLMRGGDIASFCECVAVRFVSQIDYTDSGNEVSTGLKWKGAQAVCLGASKK